MIVDQEIHILPEQGLIRLILRNREAGEGLAHVDLTPDGVEGLIDVLRTGLAILSEGMLK